MPHDLARHALLAGDTGAAKALALVRQIWHFSTSPSAQCIAM
jgi:hypothetical protein